MNDVAGNPSIAHTRLDYQSAAKKHQGGNFQSASKSSRRCKIPADVKTVESNSSVVPKFSTQSRDIRNLTANG